MTGEVSSCLAPQRGERLVSWVSMRISDPIVNDPPLQFSLLATTSLRNPWDMLCSQHKPLQHQKDDLSQRKSLCLDYLCCRYSLTTSAFDNFRHGIFTAELLKAESACMLYRSRASIQSHQLLFPKSLSWSSRRR
jgi:hypothetical protein